MSYMSRFVAAIVGLLVMALFASRQLFLFAVFRDSQGGRYHLWLAISAGIAACIAGALMFHFFLRHERNNRSKGLIAHIGPRVTVIGDKPSTNSPTAATFDGERWAQLNPWLSEGQADDRLPMNGSVPDSGRTTSAQRAFAGRSHQMMFKKWSQARHD